jgi:hypothetical protein
VVCCADGCRRLCGRWRLLRLDLRTQSDEGHPEVRQAATWCDSVARYHRFGLQRWWADHRLVCRLGSRELKDEVDSRQGQVDRGVGFG